MQKIAAYLLQRRDGLETREARAPETERIKSEVVKWLRSKGASAIASTGTFQPEDEGEGRFSIQEATDSGRSWWKLTLDEVTVDGRRFVTALSITCADQRVSVYVTLEAGWTITHIMPGSVDARCPKIVRNLLGLPGRWYHGASMLSHLDTLRGWTEGSELAAEIKRDDRSIPLLVVSTDGGQPALPDLGTKLAYDLAGLANVVVIDDDASWALTDILGAEFACYWGAVRVYWPHFSANPNGFFHPLWTAGRLRPPSSDGLQTRDRFRGQLRRLFFRAAALSVVRPREIDDIRDADERRTITELKQRASSLEDYQSLAEDYSTDNDRLREERKSLGSQVEDLEARLAKVENDRQALLWQLGALKGATEDDVPGPIEAIPPAQEGDGDVARPPEKGEVRFYKKTYSKRSYDCMVLTGDCGCNKWEGAHSADKAQKGVARFEKGRNDWSQFQHCASCTGGGMWRVRW